MSKHPLDIGLILKSKGVAAPSQSLERKETQKPAVQNHSKAYASGINLKKSEVKPLPRKVEASTPKRNFYIRREYWSKLNEDCRRRFSSRHWKDVDFNPMLENLDQPEKISQQWLNWAIPTYVLGLKGGPIQDWLEGRERKDSFHYVLVGQHLKHIRETKKIKDAEKAAKKTMHEGLQEKLGRLSAHVEWLDKSIEHEKKSLRA